jgi:uncharacterized protein YdeI (YjbR/CyaY-like superfamily)
MKPAGLSEIARAKHDGRWDAAYDSASTATVPADFQSALDSHPRALAFFQTLDSRNRTPCCSAYKPRRKPKPAPRALRNSCTCWRTMKNCIHDASPCF